MNEGWIKLYRSFTNKAFYSSDSEKVHLWIHLLLKATHSGREELFGGKPFMCKAGQFTTGRKQLSIETGISESKVERVLTYLEKIEHQIEQQKSRSNRLISIVNWSDFQLGEQQNEHQSNNDRTTTEHTIRMKERNNDKKDNINISFERFFDQFHNVTKLKKTDKSAALKKWKALSEIEKVKALENISNYFNSLSDKKYCKKARTYLNDKNFNDEFENIPLNYDVKPKGKIRQ